MPFFKSVLRLGLLAGLVGMFGVLVGVAGASWHWSFDLAAQFLLPASISGVAIVAVALIFNWVRIAGAAVMATAIAFVVAMPFTASPAPVPKEATRFTLLLFNVWYHNGKLDDVRKMVEESNADIVVLIETAPRVSAAMQSLSEIYPYRFDCASSPGCEIMMFARSRLTPRFVKATSDPDASPLVAVDTDIAGCALTLFATHMTRPFPNRPYWAQRAQAREIGGDIGSSAGAKLIVGDFNAAPWGYVIGTIMQRGGVDVLTGWGGTWPSALPSPLRIPIDNMMASRGLSFVSRRVMPTIGSDHVPVLAEIAVTDRTACR